MLEVLTQHPIISNFLTNFPKHQWRKCIEATTILGIHSVQTRHPQGLNFNTLLRLAGLPNQTSPIDKALKNIKQDLSRMTQAVQKLSSQKNIQPRVKPVRRVVSPTNRQAIQYKAPDTKRSESKQRRLPRYLKDVKSKIKGDVKKDIAMYNYRQVADSSLKRSQSGLQLHSQQPSPQRWITPKPEIFEPTTIPLNEANTLKDPILHINSFTVSPEEDNILKIADDFLNNPFTNMLTRERVSMPQLVPPKNK